MKNIKSIIVLSLLLLAVVAASILVRRTQETRRGAYFDGTDLVLIADSQVGLGEDFDVELVLRNIDENTRVTGIDLTYVVEGAEIVSIDVNPFLANDMSMINGNEAMIVAYTQAKTEDIIPILRLARMRLRANSRGVVKIYPKDGAPRDVAGVNTGNMDKGIEVRSMQGAEIQVIGSGVTPTSGGGEVTPTSGAGQVTPTSGAGQVTPTSGAGHVTPTSGAGQVTPTSGAGQVTPTSGAGQVTPTSGAGQVTPTSGAGQVTPTSGALGEAPLFRFLVRFSGVNEDTSYNMTQLVQIKAVSATGQSRTYNDVVVSRAEGYPPGVYYGDWILTGFPKGFGNYVLIKGPKHLRMKYCRNGQVGLCTEVGGDIPLVADFEDGGLSTNITSTGDNGLLYLVIEEGGAPVFDFTGWPILAGDLPDADGVQDEVVDVGDYTRMVNSLSAERRTDPEWVGRNDVNGNNMIETLDLGALLETLSEHYGAMY